MPSQVQRRAPVFAGQVMRCDSLCVTAMLHNIAAKAGVALVEPEDIEVDDDEEKDRCEDGLPHNYAAGFHARRRVIETFF